MKLIVALGNPGQQYANTRHNAGWLAVDRMAPDLSYREKLNSLVAELAPGVLVMKPQTFMNDSGAAVAEAVRFWKVDAARDLLIVHDDTDIRLGEIREVQNSSSAGHNGVQSIIDQLGTNNFHRIRIGIETRENRSEKPTDAFVLEGFTPAEMRVLLESIFPKVAGMVRQFAGLS